MEDQQACWFCCFWLIYMGHEFFVVYVLKNYIFVVLINDGYVAMNFNSKRSYFANIFLSYNISFTKKVWFGCLIHSWPSHLTGGYGGFFSFVLFCRLNLWWTKHFIYFLIQSQNKLHNSNLDSRRSRNCICCFIFVMHMM